VDGGNATNGLVAETRSRRADLTAPHTRGSNLSVPGSPAVGTRPAAGVPGAYSSGRLKGTPERGSERRSGRRPSGAARGAGRPAARSAARGGGSPGARRASAPPPSGAVRVAPRSQIPDGQSEARCREIAEGTAQRRGVIRFVGMQLGWALARPTGLPRGPMIGGMASTSGSSWVASWALAAESRTASGMPLRSTTKWYFEPGLPRSVGFGPVASPPFWRGH